MFFFQNVTICGALFGRTVSTRLNSVTITRREAQKVTKMTHSHYKAALLSKIVPCQACSLSIHSTIIRAYISMYGIRGYDMHLFYIY